MIKVVFFLCKGNTLNEAKKQGFSNVHDYLVHQETREECGVIQSRKLQFSWGLWMRKTYSDPEPTTESTADTLYFVEKILDKTIIDRFGKTNRYSKLLSQTSCIKEKILFSKVERFSFGECHMGAS